MLEQVLHNDQCALHAEGGIDVFLSPVNILSRHQQVRVKTRFLCMFQIIQKMR
jgi:hypothetical protein